MMGSTVVVLVVVCNHYNSTSVHIDPLQNKLAGQSLLGAVNWSCVVIYSLGTVSSDRDQDRSVT